jgi:hypothetical protein
MLDTAPPKGLDDVNWVVLVDDEFAAWLETQDRGVQLKIAQHLQLLERLGPNMGRPRVDTVNGSKFANMKELRFQYGRDPWRVLFAFDPRRRAILLVGGNKTGDKRWYDVHIPIADARFARHLKKLAQEGEGT